MNILILIFFGMVVSLIIYKKSRLNLFWNILLGIFGSLAAYLEFSFIKIASLGSLGVWASLFGAVTTVHIGRYLNSLKQLNFK